MGIVTPAPPREVEAAFLRELPAFLSGPAADGEVEEQFAGKPHVLPALKELGFSDERVQYTTSQQVFVLDAADVAKSGDVSRAVPAGWRFFAGREAATILGRVSFRPPGRWKLTGVSCGEPVWRVLQAAYSLDTADLVRDGDFELRVLLMPGIYVDAYWLASRDRAGGDLLTLFPGRRDHPLARRWSDPVYPMAEVLASLRPQARLQSRARSKRAVVLAPAPATAS